MNIKVKIENQTFDVRIGDLNTRPILATVDGQTFEVWPEETPRMGAAPVVVPAVVSAIAAKPASASTSTVPAGSITAPIPGVIIVVAVKEGETVKKGQEVCVLEAMKMKNSIRSSRDGVIGEVKVKVGDHVTHGQALISYKD
jgi:biotin carboxyl carrier protein